MNCDVACHYYFVGPYVALTKVHVALSYLRNIHVALSILGVKAIVVGFNGRKGRTNNAAQH